jgi:hypothetical protein
MSSTPKDQASAKDPKDLRLRKQHFPKAEELIFDKAKKGYVPLPILMRKAMRYLSAPEVRVLVYLQTRCSQYCICYPSLDEIAYDLDLSGRKNVTPHIKELERKKFISTATGAGKKFFLVHDPAVAIGYLAGEGAVVSEQLDEINDLLDNIGRPPISVAPSAKNAKVTPITQPKTA